MIDKSVKIVTTSPGEQYVCDGCNYRSSIKAPNQPYLLGWTPFNIMDPNGRGTISMDFCVECTVKFRKINWWNIIKKAINENV